MRAAGAGDAEPPTVEAGVVPLVGRAVVGSDRGGVDEVHAEPARSNATATTPNRGRASAGTDTRAR